MNAEVATAPADDGVTTDAFSADESFCLINVRCQARKPTFPLTFPSYLCIILSVHRTKQNRKKVYHKNCKTSKHAHKKKTKMSSDQREVKQEMQKGLKV